VSCSVSGEGGVGEDFTVNLNGVDGSKFAGIGTRVGVPGQWVRNSNGSFDVGALQFNTAYLKDLAAFGISPKDVAAPGCYPYLLAAWRIRGHLREEGGDIWTRAANYHSRTPRFNAIYRADLMRRATRWSAWLDRYFPTHDAIVDSPYQGTK
jgi:hypothetical protein